VSAEGGGTGDAAAKEEHPVSRSTSHHSPPPPGIDRLGPLGRHVIAMSRRLRAGRQLAVRAALSRGGARSGDGGLGRGRRAG
jgi:hypothetical protein